MYILYEFPSQQMITLIYVTCISFAISRKNPADMWSELLHRHDHPEEQDLGAEDLGAEDLGAGACGS